ncbi:ABC transporter permease [Dactylosporangium sp. NPDC051484]|uniref:ABC transporter permease n=1 Tax=Dactylosporangium sp. NPDC051484 TaxID=3154942 RepID=UPI00344D63F5
MHAYMLVLRHYWVLKRNRPWGLIVNGVFEPFLYLLSIGLGIGQLVSTFTDHGRAVTDYAAFVAPALLATSAMNSAIYETTNLVWFRLRFEKVYDAIVTTPMTPTDVGHGEIVAAMLRGALASSCFLGVIAALGLVHSLWALLVIPGALLVAFAFAAGGLAAATFIKAQHHHQYLQLVMLPMFLFATTFYPLSVYPALLRGIVVCLPLYHAIELLRSVCMGQFGAPLLISTVYLVLFGAASVWLADRRLTRMLVY